MNSQYTDSYLAETANGHLITPGTYLTYQLRGRAKQWAGRYHSALVRSLERVGAVPVPSVGRSTAYVRPGQAPWWN
jgi:hypothetical protein